MSNRLLLLYLTVLLLTLSSCSTRAVQTSEGIDRDKVQATAEPTSDLLIEERLALVERTMRSRGIADQRVLAVMESVPRHEFVPEEYINLAYADHPLPIGYGQTISQPYMVALMTELLGLQPSDRVLEIGTGSGYQAAILAELVDEVWTIEIIPELADQAAERFERLGYDNIHTRIADGYYGWIEEAPFDAIIVTAAPDHIPQPLLDQLTDNGRLVVPVGPPGGYQSLWQLVREGENVKAFNLGGVQFVPLVGGGQSGGSD